MDQYLDGSEKSGLGRQAITSSNFVTISGTPSPIVKLSITKYLII